MLAIKMAAAKLIGMALLGTHLFYELIIEFFHKDIP